MPPTLPPDAGDALAAGTVIDGEYRIEGMLGRGGMGVVYRARDLRLDRPVAVKVHREKGMAHERLAREATALARLSHPTVVSVYRVGTHAGRVYVAMELVEGGTLRRTGGDPPPWREVLRRHCAAGDGLAAAHAAGLVHRDYKPDNVLLGDDGRPRVADFGLARAAGESGTVAIGESSLATAETVEISDSPAAAPGSATVGADGAATTGILSPGAYLAHVPETPRTPRLDERLTQTGAWVGTPAYLAPEQIDGGMVDARSDQFAFAVSLWEALHGRRPFAGETTLLLRAAIARQQLEGAGDGGVPGWIDDILRRALLENADERWPSMNDILIALRHDPARRRQQIALGIGAVALAGVAAAVAWQAKSRPSARANCGGGTAEIARTWGPAQAETLRASFAKTDLPYAAALADSAVAELDAYATRWARGHEVACTARADRTWSADLADRAVACLSRRQRSLAESIAVIEGLEVGMIDDALEITGGLAPPDECVDPARLAGQVLPPSDPAKARLHDELITVLARAEALCGVFDPRAKEHAERGVALAAELGSPRLIADAAAIRAEAAHIAGDPDALQRYEAAFFAGRSAGDERGANAVALRLVFLSLRAERMEEARSWLRHGSAGVAAGADGELRATLAMNQAMIEASDGHLEQAVAHLEEARQRLATTIDSERYLPNLIDLEANILGEIGELPRAIELGREAVRMVESRFGPAHPILVSRLSNLALSLSEIGENDEAVATMRRAVAVCRPAPMCRDELPVNLLNLGAVEVNAGKFAEALLTLDEAEHGLEAMGEAGLGDRALVASARGRAFDELGRVAEAEAALRAGVAMSEQAHGVDHPDVAQVLNNRGDLLNTLRRHAEAAPLLERALAIWEKAAPGAPQAGLPMLALGRAQLGMGKAKPAIVTLRAAIERLERGGMADRLPLARLRLSQALWTDGQRAEALRLAGTLGAPTDDPATDREIAAWRNEIGAMK